MRRDFRWKVPPKYNIAVDVCDKHAKRRGKLAMIFRNSDGTVKEYSFLDFKKLSNKVANLLCALGVRRGDRVCVLLPRLPETAAIFLGVYKLGAILVSLSSLYGKDGVRYRLTDSAARVLIIDAGHRQVIEGLTEELESLQAIVVLGDPQHTCSGDLSFETLMNKASDRFTVADTSPDDPAQIYYSSGTTGLAKGILHGHRYLLAHNEFELVHEVRDDELFWSTSEWAWIAGIVPGLLGPWRHGVPVFAFNAPGKFDPEETLSLAQKFEVGNMFVTPTALRMMMQVPNPKAIPKFSVRAICSAGEPVNPEIVWWIRESFGITLLEYYGLTESYPLCSNFRTMTVRPGSMGKAMPGWEVAVLDEKNNPVPTGTVGVICLKARSNPHYPLGYWRRPEDTQKVFGGTWFRTGDAAYRDEDGYFWFQGRADDVIISSGYRIGPFEVESALLEHPAVAQSAAVAAPDRERGNIVKAFICLVRGCQPSEVLKREIQNHVRKNLAAYAYPREIEFVDELPTTITGKIQRGKLRRREIEKNKLV